MRFDSWQTDELDLVRALLSALAWREDDALSPVSSISIHHELLRRDRSFSAVEALNTLALIGDAQRLDHGYWLPCPTHGATNGHIVIVVSGQPTDRLVESHGSAIRHGEYGRYVVDSNNLKGHFASISLSQWLGTPASSIEWLHEYLSSAAFAPPLKLEDTEVYRHWRGTGRRWIQLTEGLKSGKDFVLARVGSHRAKRYIILRIARHALMNFHELAPGSDVVRIMCALHATAEDAISVAIKMDNARAQLLLSSPIVPNKERLFLHCVGFVKELVARVDAVLPLNARADVERLFNALGCNVQDATT